MPAVALLYNKESTVTVAIAQNEYNNHMCESEQISSVLPLSLGGHPSGH